MENLKKLFSKLQTDSKSVLFTEEKLSNKLLQKLRKSKYNKDKEFVNSFNLLENKEDLFKRKNENSIPVKAFKKVMISIVLLYLAYKHPLIFAR